MEVDGINVARRKKGASDTGEYVLRLTTCGDRKSKNEGVSQGIFAPEYATAETNYLSRALLAWLIIKSEESPYCENSFDNLKQILINSDILSDENLSNNHILHNGITCCPLCLKTINYSELHEMISYEGADALANSSEQIAGSTRATKINLFHITPLCYESLEHKPSRIAWGHAICNTVLGQRFCVSLKDIIENGYKINLLSGKKLWVNENENFMRSEQGEVWIKISD